MAPEEKSATRLQQAQEDRERWNEKPLELFARALSREHFRFLGFEHCGRGMCLEQFVQFLLFQPLAFLEPHLEPAHRRNE